MLLHLTILSYYIYTNGIFSMSRQSCTNQLGQQHDDVLGWFSGFHAPYTPFGLKYGQNDAPPIHPASAEPAVFSFLFFFFLVGWVVPPSHGHMFLIFFSRHEYLTTQVYAYFSIWLTDTKHWIRDGDTQRKDRRGLVVRLMHPTVSSEMVKAI